MKASTYEKGSAFAACVKGGWPHVPRTLLVVGLVLLLLGAAVALAVLASCGFEPWTLAQAPSVNLFGQDVIGLVDMRNQFLIKLRIISAAADGSCKIYLLIHKLPSVPHYRRKVLPALRY